MINTLYTAMLWGIGLTLGATLYLVAVLLVITSLIGMKHKPESYTPTMDWWVQWRAQKKKEKNSSVEHDSNWTAARNENLPSPVESRRRAGPKDS